MPQSGGGEDLKEQACLAGVERMFTDVHGYRTTCQSRRKMVSASRHSNRLWLEGHYPWVV